MKVYIIQRPSESEGCHSEYVVEGVFSSKEKTEEFISKFDDSYYLTVEIEMDYWNDIDLDNKQPYQVIFVEKDYYDDEENPLEVFSFYQIIKINKMNKYFHTFYDKEVWMNDYPLSLNVFLFAYNEDNAKKEAIIKVEEWLSLEKNKKYIKDGWLDEKYRWRRLIF